MEFIFMRKIYSLIRFFMRKLKKAVCFLGITIFLTCCGAFISNPDGFLDTATGTADKIAKADLSSDDIKKAVTDTLDMGVNNADLAELTADAIRNSETGSALLAAVADMTQTDNMQKVEASEAVDFIVTENDNIPYFLAEEAVEELLNTDVLTPFEVYAPLDHLGRCNVAFANICKETMPTEERGEIGMIKPSGWHTYNFGKLVDGNYLYNRCHLIAFCLAGENANECNLITGTRYLNTEGMLPYEEKILTYVKETGHHVFYRVTPLFVGDELVARAVRLEAYSVEDNGSGICFNVKIANIQPGVNINYATGEAAVMEDKL